MILNDDLREMIMKNASTDELRDRANTMAWSPCVMRG